MPGFGQPQQQQQFQGQPQQQQFQQGQPQQFQGQPQPQQQFRGPQEQTLQTQVKQGGQPQRQAYYSPAPPQQGQGQGQGGQGGQGYYQPPHVPEFKVAGVGGGPYQEIRGAHRSRFNLSQLRQSDGIIPLQYGTNRFASQKGMTGFGSPRDVNGKHLHRVWDDFYTDEGEGYDDGQQQQQQQQYYAQQ